jgi:nickel transport protein
MRLLLTILLLLCTGTAAAHEVDHAIAAVNAVSLRLSYADGNPFAYEKYELYAEGQDVPAQVGNTDAQGRVTFMPDDIRQWRLKAWSADGHGIDVHFTAPTLQINADAVGESRPNHLSLLLFGLGLLLSVFGIYQLAGRKKQ